MSVHLVNPGASAHLVAEALWLDARNENDRRASEYLKSAFTMGTERLEREDASWHAFHLGEHIEKTSPELAAYLIHRSAAWDEQSARVESDVEDVWYTYMIAGERWANLMPTVEPGLRRQFFFHMLEEAFGSALRVSLIYKDPYDRSVSGIKCLVEKANVLINIGMLSEGLAAIQRAESFPRPANVDIDSIQKARDYHGDKFVESLLN